MRLSFTPGMPPLLFHPHFPIGNKPGQDPAPESATEGWIYRRGAGGAGPRAVSCWPSTGRRYRLRVGESQPGRRHPQEVGLQLVPLQQRSGFLQREGEHEQLHMASFCKTVAMPLCFRGASCNAAGFFRLTDAWSNPRHKADPLNT